MWAHALSIYSSTKFSFSLVASQRRPNVPKLTRARVVSVSEYIQKIPNVNGAILTELDSHLAQTSIKLISMGVYLDTRQANLILLSYFMGKLGHWAPASIADRLTALASIRDVVCSGATNTL